MTGNGCVEPVWLDMLADRSRRRWRGQLYFVATSLLEQLYGRSLHVIVDVDIALRRGDALVSCQ